ncbi:CDP-diacylglycerol diphosphatase [Lichenicola cladoniae]|nr:CDP-diacylglycerol diphosphatase [Lichenicola cladoniae]
MRGLAHAGLIAGMLFGLAAPGRPAFAHDSDAIWKIVHGRCLPSLQATHTPAPCVSVDLAGGETRGFAILKDIEGASQYLLIPTAKITGIESPAILAPDATNYFAHAWDAVTLVGERLGRVLPRRDLALAINSERGRSQNQLHIHVDCISVSARAALDRAAVHIGTHWQMLPRRLALHRYRAIWLPGEELGDTNPFQVLAHSLADPGIEMARHTLVLVGAERHGQSGFILLDGRAGALSTTLSPRIKLGPGSGEELEDHSCRIAQERS